MHALAQLPPAALDVLVELFVDPLLVPPVPLPLHATAAAERASATAARRLNVLLRRPWTLRLCPSWRENDGLGFSIESSLALSANAHDCALRRPRSLC